MNLAKELKALILCCRFKHEKELKNKIKNIIEQQDFDWSHFLKLANFHREIPLVYYAISKVIDKKNLLTPKKKILPNK